MGAELLISLVVVLRIADRGVGLHCPAHGAEWAIDRRLKIAGRAAPEREQRRERAMEQQGSVQFYLWSARLFLASVVFQVFAIGLYLFAGYDLGPHLLGALIVTVMSVVVLISTFAARLPGRAKRWAGALFVLTIVQGILPGFKDTDLAVIGALHPVNALLLFGLGLVILRDAQERARMPAPEPAAKSEAPATST
jgi:hypothetical protein